MKSTDLEPPTSGRPVAGEPLRPILACFILALLATAPALLVLGLSVLPRLARLEAAADRIEVALARVEGAANLTYFSRDPSRSSVEEALAHLQYWTELETKARAFELPHVHQRQEMAVSALIAAGAAGAGRIEQEALRQDLGPWAKYYRRALLKVLARVAPEAAAGLADQLLAGEGFDAQTRLFAATEYLALAPEKAGRGLRALLDRHDHLTLDGFANLLGLYVNQAPDPAKGELLQKILQRPTLDLATLMEIIQGVPALSRTDPYLVSLAQDLKTIYLRPDALRERFRSALLLRPQGASLLPTVRLGVVRSLGAVLPRTELAAFLEQVERLETDHATLGAIARIRQEQGL